MGDSVSMEMASKACRITEFTGIKKLPVNIRWMPNIHWADATKMVCGRQKKTWTKRLNGTKKQQGKMMHGRNAVWGI